MAICHALSAITRNRNRRVRCFAVVISRYGVLRRLGRTVGLAFVFELRTGVAAG